MLAAAFPAHAALVSPTVLRSNAVPSPAATPSRPLRPVVAHTHGRPSFIVPTVTLEERHQSGWDVKVRLDGKGRTWRSGETLRGQVAVVPRAGMEQQKVTSLIVRCFWMATTLYTTFSYTRDPYSHNMLSPPGHATYIEQAEYHRGYATDGDGLELPVDERLSAGTASSHDFAFVLPKTTHATFSNPSWCPPSDRHDLQKYERCAPPSFAPPTGDIHDGTVEWVVEVLLRTEADPGRSFSASGPSDELPSFAVASAAVGEHASRGLLESTPSVLVKRITFPFEPYDRYVEDYQRAWHDDAAPVIPSLGRDPRDELSMSKRVDPGEMAPERLVLREDREVAWSTYFREIAVKGGLMGKSSTLRAEISLPSPLTTTRSSPSIPFILHLRHLLPSRSKSFLSFGGPSPSGSTTPRLAKVEKLTLTLTERILKRGGCAVRPTMDLHEILREGFHLGELPQTALAGSDLSRASTASDGSTPSQRKKGQQPGKRPRLALRADSSSSLSTISSASSSSSSSFPSLDAHLPPSTLDVPLSFNLRAPFSSTLGPSRPLGLTFRTPALEREYILSASLTLAGQGAVVVARVPVQVLSGEEGPETTDEEEGEEDGRRDAGDEAQRREKLPLYPGL
ncbi:hypothetical protein JCM10207_008099 [Rhodosporidiobolus poonsookiae]